MPRNHAEIHDVDHVVAIQVREDIKAGIADHLAHGGFHDRDIGTIHDGIIIKVEVGEDECAATVGEGKELSAASDEIEDGNVRHPNWRTPMRPGGTGVGADPNAIIATGVNAVGNGGIENHRVDGNIERNADVGPSGNCGAEVGGAIDVGGGAAGEAGEPDANLRIVIGDKGDGRDGTVGDLVAGIAFDEGTGGELAGGADADLAGRITDTHRSTHIAKGDGDTGGAAGEDGSAV